MLSRLNVFGNPTAQRDFRVQMRGSRSVILFVVYLLLLSLAAVVTYQSVAGQQVTLAQAQASLRQFYEWTMSLLGFAITAISPALAATAVVTERHRRSFDLVFSAPVEPRAYLIGKLVASYRFTWLLLVLALPVTAVSVVLGGATWTDVLEAFVLLSFQALILTSTALLVSARAEKQVNAVATMFALVLFWFALFSVSGFLARIAMGTGLSRELPFIVGLNPFGTHAAAGSFTNLGWSIPNWILVGIFSVFVSLLLISAASISIAPSPVREIKTFRWMILSAAVLYGVLTPTLSAIGTSFGLFTGSSPMAFPPVPLGPHEVGRMLGWALIPLLVFIPSMAAYGFEGPMYRRPNGLFHWRKVMDGSPAGSAPFLLLFIATFILAMVSLFAVTGTLSRDAFIGIGVYGLWLLGCFAAVFGAVRLGSSVLSGARTGMSFGVLAIMLIVVIPVPCVSIPAFNIGSPASDWMWTLIPMSPLVADAKSLWLAQVHGAVLLAIGVTLITVSQRVLKVRLDRLKITHERLFESAA
jgi:ABC-type transport system involved in multi-copper enzyme maturation permease subunit